MAEAPLNLITDVAGLSVGNADDSQIQTGATVVICEDPTVASVSTLGGAPGTRDVALLEPDHTVQTVDAIALSGGSAFGLDTASGVQAGLRDTGRGFLVGNVTVPIVPGAIIFDLTNGGDKAWGDANPYPDFGRRAFETATDGFSLGRVGAGCGATTAVGPGGLGSASTKVGDFTVGALVVVNAVGSPYIGRSRTFWAAPFERNAEFGGRGMDVSSFRADKPVLKGTNPVENTTIGVIATDLALTKAQCKRVAVMAHMGYARALWPSHTPYDGDLVFALATGRAGRPATDADLMALSAAAPATMARAVARGVHEAEGTL